MSNQPPPKRGPKEPTTAAVAPMPSSVLQPEPSITATPAPAPRPSGPATALPPEEQMALFAKDLQENDWGHQPC
jgi:hypothetical protein